MGSETEDANATFYQIDLTRKYFLLLYSIALHVFVTKIHI